MSDRLSALRILLRVARLGSFSAAARELDISQPSVTRAIAALEAELGASLLVRTTRAVRLTEAGREYLSRVEPVLATLDEAEHQLRGGAELRGSLRVGLSSSFAVREIVPRLPRFMGRHPRLHVELLMDDQHQDLVREGVDVALRLGSLADSAAVARRLHSWPRVLAASPAYLRNAPAIRQPADLVHHTVIVGPSSREATWAFRKGAKRVSVRVGGRLAVTANELATAAAVAGLGLISMNLGGCKREIDAGRLVLPLPDWDMGSVDLHAVFASGSRLKPAARAFVDFLAAELIDTRSE